MTGKVIRNTRWWGQVERTQEPVIIDATPSPPSLDELAENIRHASNRVVQCECELAKAQQHLQDCRLTLVNRLGELDAELGFTKVPR
jgi:hypothetical protein